MAASMRSSAIRPSLGAPNCPVVSAAPTYQEWLKENYKGAFGNADLSAYFLRRAFAKAQINWNARTAGNE